MNNYKQIHHASGVFKVDYETAGYKDLFEIAKKRAEDEGFYSLIVRKVSQNNYGIQFLYIRTDIDQKEFESIIIGYQKQLQEKWKLYATDFEWSSITPSKDNETLTEQLKKRIIVQKIFE